MSMALADTHPIDPAVVERVVIHGDLRQLTPAQKVSYYNAVCASVGLNPLTRPFEYIVLNGKETFYAKRDATDQLRKVHSVSVQIMAREVTEDCYVVTARASMPNGRQDESIGAVPIGALKGESRANAMMKCETKAKRRVTLSICGLGMLDETEIETIQPASMPPVVVESPRPNPSNPASEREPESRVAPSGGEVSGHHSAGYATPDDGLLRIARVDRGTTRNKGLTKYTITMSTGEQYSTIKERLGELCQQFMQDGTPVSIGPEDVKTTQWGADLLAIHRMEKAHDVESLSGPVDESEIPF